jgi:hypothetical protein
MNKIAALLIDFGQDFEYENYCSEGEKLYCSTMGMTIRSADGRMTLSSANDTMNRTDDADGHSMILAKVHELLIEHTT